MNEKYEQFHILDCFKPGEKNDIIEGDKMPDYEDVLADLGFAMLRAATDYLSKMKDALKDKEKDEVDIFFDLYDLWAEEKKRHEQMNKYFAFMGEKEREELLPNRMVDALMSYFDGERYYDGKSYFKGLREDKITPEWRRLKLAKIDQNFEGGAN